MQRPLKDKDPIGRLFARLTGELDDATELAVKGQSRTLLLAARTTLSFRLRKRLGRAGSTLDRIDVAINVSGEVDQ